MKELILCQTECVGHLQSILNVAEPFKGLVVRTERKLHSSVFGKLEKAKAYCEEILEQYPKTKAAAEAKSLLDKLSK